MGFRQVFAGLHPAAGAAALAIWAAFGATVPKAAAGDAPRAPAGEAEAEAEGALRLRVLSFNAAGIPLVHPAWERRAPAIGREIAALAPDLAALQEVWFARDAETIATAAGLPHHVWFGSPGRSGLLILSRFPIESSRLDVFAANGHPLFLGLAHGDWLASKGVATARVRTPLGPLPFLTTHTVASFPPGRHPRDRFIPQRVAQVTEVLAALERARGGPGALPAILAGDLNAEPPSAEMRLLRACGRLSDACPDGAGDGRGRRPIDYILLAEAAPFRVEVASAERKWLPDLALDGGSRVRMSDHPYVLADLEIRRASPVPVPVPVSVSAPVPVPAPVPVREPVPESADSARRAALAILEAEIAASRAAAFAAAALALAALAALLLLLRRGARPGGRLRFRAAALALAAVAAAAGLHVVAARPVEVAALERAVRALRDAPPRPPREPEGPGRDPASRGSPRAPRPGDRRAAAPG